VRFWCNVASELQMPTQLRFTARLRLPVRLHPLGTAAVAAGIPQNASRFNTRLRVTPLTVYPITPLAPVNVTRALPTSRA
jgi:hypothetical protein